MAINFSIEESESVARILTSSCAISRRHQFFNWAHGPLQSLIPHEILLCGIVNDAGIIAHEHFSACRYFREEHFARVCDSASGLVNQLIADWRVAQTPRLIDPSPNAASSGWYNKLAALELKNLAFHAIALPGGSIHGYAVFSRVRRPFDAKLELLVRMLLPTLLGALTRVFANEFMSSRRGPRPTGPLTAREAEILAWVRDGKTNGEIAGILGLSTLTVKNHLRHCNQKLIVSTRSQAVAKAMSLGYLKPYGRRTSDQTTRAT